MKSYCVQLILLAAMAGVVGAQKAAPEPPSQSLSAILGSTVLFDELDGVHWARGKDWKASFGPEGATFIPFLGADAPRGYPVTFAFLGATVGERTIATDSRSSAQREDRRISFDRGALREVYRLAVGQIEQTFEIDAPLGGDGDLSIELSIATEMTVTATDRGVEFRAGDRGGVNYGKAVVFDADDRRAEVTQSLEDGRLTLTVPRAFLATAAYPIVIDPLLTAVTVAVYGTPLAASDNSFLIEVTTGADTYATVFESTFTSIDRDIFVVLVDFLGNIGATYTVDFTTSDWRGARIASNGNSTSAGYTAGDFMVAARRTVTGASQAMCRGLGLGGPVTGQIVVSPPGHTVVSVDIGGDPDYVAFTGSENRYAIAYEQAYSPTDHDIYCAMVTASGAISLPSFAIDTSLFNETSPRISESCGRDDGSFTGSGKAWTIVWERTINPSDRDIYARSLEVAGTLMPLYNVWNGIDDDHSPTVSAFTDGAGGSRTALITWQTNYTSILTDSDIFGAIVSTTGLMSFATNLSVLDTPTNISLSQMRPQAAANGCRFAVAYVEPWAPNPIDLDIYVSTFRFNGVQIVCDEPHRALANTVAVEDQPTIAGYLPFQIPSYFSSEYFACWTNFTDNSIRGRIYAGHAPLAPVIYLPTQVGIASLGAYGAPILGAFFNFGMSGPDPAHLQILWIGAPLPAPVPVLGPIQLGVADPPFLAIDNVSGSSPFTPDLVGFVVPCDQALIGITLAVQGFAIGPVGELAGVPIPGTAGLEVSCTDVVQFTFQ